MKTRLRFAILILLLTMATLPVSAFPKWRLTATPNADKVTGNWDSFKFNLIGYNDYDFTLSVTSTTGFVTLTGYNMAVRIGRTNVTYVDIQPANIAITNYAVYFSIPATNIPPDATYQMELWGYEGATTNIARSFAQGQVVTRYSLYGDTNQFPFPAAGASLAGYLTITNAAATYATWVGLTNAVENAISNQVTVATNLLLIDLTNRFTVADTIVSNGAKAYTDAATNANYNALYTVITNGDWVSSNGAYWSAVTVASNNTTSATDTLWTATTNAIQIASNQTYVVITNLDWIVTTNLQAQIAAVGVSQTYVDTQDTLVSNGAKAYCNTVSNLLRIAYTNADRIVSNGLVAYTDAATNTAVTWVRFQNYLAATNLVNATNSLAIVLTNADMGLWLALGVESNRIGIATDRIDKLAVDLGVTTDRVDKLRADLSVTTDRVDKAFADIMVLSNRVGVAISDVEALGTNAWSNAVLVSYWASNQVVTANADMDALATNAWSNVVLEVGSLATNAWSNTVLRVNSLATNAWSNAVIEAAWASGQVVVAAADIDALGTNAWSNTVIVAGWASNTALAASQDIALIATNEFLRRDGSVMWTGNQHMGNTALIHGNAISGPEATLNLVSGLMTDGTNHFNRSALNIATRQLYDTNAVASVNAQARSLAGNAGTAVIGYGTNLVLYTDIDMQRNAVTNTAGISAGNAVGSAAGTGSVDVLNLDLCSPAGEEWGVPNGNLRVGGRLYATITLTGDSDAGGYSWTNLATNSLKFADGSKITVDGEGVYYTRSTGERGLLATNALPTDLAPVWGGIATESNRIDVAQTNWVAQVAIAKTNEAAAAANAAATAAVALTNWTAQVTIAMTNGTAAYAKANVAMTNLTQRIVDATNGIVVTESDPVAVPRIDTLNTNGWEAAITTNVTQDSIIYYMSQTQIVIRADVDALPSNAWNSAVSTNVTQDYAIGQWATSNAMMVADIGVATDRIDKLVLDLGVATDRVDKVVADTTVLSNRVGTVILDVAAITTNDYTAAVGSNVTQDATIGTILASNVNTRAIAGAASNLAYAVSWREQQLPAECWTPDITDGALTWFDAEEQLYSLHYADGSQQWARAWTRLPTNYSSGLAMRYYWTSTSTNNGGVAVWGVQNFVEVSGGTCVPVWSNTTFATLAYVSSNVETASAWTPVVGAPTAGRVVQWRICRNATNDADTLNIFDTKFRGASMGYWVR